MAKMTIKGVTYEGTPEELREIVRTIEEGVVEKETFKEGDYVVGNDSARYNVTNDEMILGEVVNGELDGQMTVKVLRHKIAHYEGDFAYPVNSKYFRKATDEEIAEATAPKFEEGEYVKTLARGQFNDVEKGEIVRIRGTNKVDKYSVYAETTEGDTDFFRPQDLEKLEGKDVERAVQFAKAGRKLNEFKKGDVVSANWTSRSESGGLFEVENGPIGTESGGNFEFKGGDVTLGKYLTLIAPVESRVDVK